MRDPLQGLLKRGGLGGVFFLQGADEFRKDQAVRALVEAHLDPATRDFNLDRLRGRDVGTEQLASVLGTPPMMAEWRVVVITEVEGLANSSRAREILVSTAQAPPPGLALILSCTPPSKAKFYTQLAGAARSLEFRPLGQDDVPGWLMERAREELGVEMDPAAARALAQAVGTDLGVLSQELEKLSGYVQEGRPITREDVAAAGTYLPTQDRWGWLDLVGHRRFTDALAGLRVLMAQGESGVGLVLALANHFLRMGVIREMGAQELVRLLPPNQKWLARQLGDQARGWGSEEIASALEGLRLMDRRMKSSSVSEESLLQSWILERMACTP